MMFQRKKPTECSLDCFARWLRAQRPPFEWFVRQGELVQEALAREGDDYVRSCLEGGAEAAEDAEVLAQQEEVSARCLGAELANRIMGKPSGPQLPTTMGGKKEPAPGRRKSFMGQQNPEVPH